jgi:hypothetical protein
MSEQHTTKGETEMSEYISVADTAKMLREALRRHWPEIKFSVRSKSYAGGASIRVAWLNGPSSSMVDHVAQRFAGADFDGMIDLKSYHRDLLVAPDGTMREVHFGADFVFCRRETDDALMPACVTEYERICVVQSHQDMNSRDYWINQALAETYIPKGEPIETTAKRVAHRVFHREEMEAAS